MPTPKHSKVCPRCKYAWPPVARDCLLCEKDLRDIDPVVLHATHLGKFKQIVIDQCERESVYICEFENARFGHCPRCPYYNGVLRYCEFFKVLNERCERETCNFSLDIQYTYIIDKLIKGFGEPIKKLCCTCKNLEELKKRMYNAVGKKYD